MAEKIYSLSGVFGCPKCSKGVSLVLTDDEYYFVQCYGISCRHILDQGTNKKGRELWIKLGELAQQVGEIKREIYVRRKV